MNKIYSRIQWENYPSVLTPINEINLNHMDYAINQLDDNIVTLDTVKAEQSVVLNTINDWTLDPDSGIITITKVNGEQILFDLNIEKIPVSFTLSEDGILTMTTDDGTEFVTNISKLIPILTFENSNTIGVKVVTNGIDKTYSFEVINGSITDEKIQPNYLADLTTQANNSANSEAKAKEYRDLSQSYSVGTNNVIRAGDTTDNARYYYIQTKQMAQGIINGGLLPMGDILFEDLPLPVTEGEGCNIGHLYRITNDFVINDSFETPIDEITYFAAKTHVYITTAGKYAILSTESKKFNSNAIGMYSHAEGSGTKANGRSSHAEGNNTTAGGDYSHAEGSSTLASGKYSHAEGFMNNATANYAHVEGNMNDAANTAAHAEGYNTTASGMYSHAEGENTNATARATHAEGIETFANATYAHAEGNFTTAAGNSSHAEGYHTYAMGSYSHVSGAYNDEKVDDIYQVGIGGISEASEKNNCQFPITLPEQIALAANTDTVIYSGPIPINSNEKVSWKALRGILRTSLNVTNNNATMTVTVTIEDSVLGGSGSFTVSATNYYGSFYFIRKSSISNVGKNATLTVVVNCSSKCDLLIGSTLFTTMSKINALSINRNGEISYSGKINRHYVELYAQNGSFTSTINLETLAAAGLDINDYSELIIAIGNTAKTLILNTSSIPLNMTKTGGGRIGEIRCYVASTYSRVYFDSPTQIRLHCSHTNYSAILIGVK